MQFSQLNVSDSKIHFSINCKIAELPAYTFKCNPAMTSHDITLNIEVKAHAGNATQNIHPLLDRGNSFYKQEIAVNACNK